MLFSAPAENGSEDASGPDPDGSGVDAALLPADLNGRAADRPRLSVVIPTRNEERNVEPLLAGLGEVFDAARTEIIFVDDSDDRTPQLIAVGARACPVHIRLLQRPPSARKGGLSGAGVLGARHAPGDWELVLHADLQHAPETASLLDRHSDRSNCDRRDG